MSLCIRDDKKDLRFITAYDVRLLTDCEEGFETESGAREAFETVVA